MNNLTLKLVSLSLAVTANTAIADVDHSKNQAHYYVGTQLATQLGSLNTLSQTDHTIENATLLSIYAGRYVPNGFGFEFDVATNISTADITTSLTQVGAGRRISDAHVGESDLRKLGGYLTYHYLPSGQSNFYLKGKIGIAHLKTDNKYVYKTQEVDPANSSNLIETTTISSPRSESELGLSTGLSAGYWLTPDLVVQGEYNYSRLQSEDTRYIYAASNVETVSQDVKHNLHTLGIGLNYHF